MGDPLSVAASVVGLLSLGLQTTEYLHKYYTALRERDQNIARTVSRLDSLHQSVRTIHENVYKRQWYSKDGAVLQNVEQSVVRCEDIILELENEVRNIKQTPTDQLGRALSAVKRPLYPLRQSTLMKLNEQVDVFRDNLSLALQALQLNDLQNTQSDIEDIKNIMKNSQAQHLSASVRQWLKAPDATLDFNNACTKRHGKTGQWLIQSADFTAWLQQSNSFLWLYGFAGCGKSVLCSTTIQQAFRHKLHQSDSALAFFFFTFNDTLKRDGSAAVRALLLQLCGQVAGLEAELNRLKDSLNDGFPSTTTLVEYLRQAVTKCQHTYIFLDAIDESNEEYARIEVLSIVETMRGWQLPGLHLLVTSRDIPDIRDCLSAQEHTPNAAFIPLKDSGLDKDICEFVSHQLENDPQLRRWGKHCSRIRDHLIEYARGVFRWVECQLHPLRQCARSKRHLDYCLSSLPHSLDDTYARMLCNISPESREEVRQMLSLLCYSPRPLFVDEVIGAIAVDVEGQQCYDPERELEGAEDLLRICPGLITINPTFGGNGTHDEAESHEGRQLVQIAHFSVREYLVSDRIRKSEAAFYALSELAEAKFISKLCLIYLLDPHFISDTWNAESSFALFASRYWHHFYTQTGPEFVREMLEKIEALLTQGNVFKCWSRLHDKDRSSWIDEILGYGVDDFTPMYCAAFLGLQEPLAKFITVSPIDINAKGGKLGKPLHAASVKGHTVIVQMLLDNGAEINDRGGHFGTALQAASIFGHETTVQLLLDKGADLNIRREFSDEVPLQQGSAEGHENVVKIILDKGADINAQGGRLGDALQEASWNGREKVVKLLLDRGADPNAQGGKYRNALLAASRMGHGKVVRMLLDMGATVNAVGGLSDALIAASRNGHEKVVKMLLDTGANVNGVDGTSSAALVAASRMGYEEIVQLLLDAGARWGDESSLPPERVESGFDLSSPPLGRAEQGFRYYQPVSAARRVLDQVTLQAAKIDRYNIPQRYRRKG